LCDQIIEVDCNTVRIAYENRSSITSSDGVASGQVWLESGFLAKYDSRLLLRFFHSTRAQ